MVGRLIDGRYQVRSRIARGGMATVYLATDLRLERRVAIKIMHGHLADDSQFKERFIQEARSAARLAHPNVVNVFDQGQDSDMAYLVMEYLPGITLRDLLVEHSKLTTEQSFDVLEAVLSGLSAAHKAGIVHRDLKPENVLLADDGRIKIGDFGLARAVSANTATGAALLGTIAYLSPELVTRGVADARSDIYAVGIMMYEMLTGEQPFKGEQPMQIAYQHANDSVPTPSSKNPKIPAELDELVLWATAREPEERPRDARIMLDQLLSVQNALQSASLTGATSAQRTMVLPTAKSPKGSNDATQVLRPAARHRTGPVAPASTTVLSVKSKRRRSRGWWLFGLVLVLAGLAGGTGWYFGAGPGSQVTIPDLTGSTTDAAIAALSDQGFLVDEKMGQDTDPRIENGLVVRTSPTVGSVVAKGGKVRLVLSAGPAQLQVPRLVGKSEDEAKALIVSSGFTVSTEEPIRQFDSDVAKGVVLAAYDTQDKRLKEGAKYSEQRPISLMVSSGPLPKVRGLSVAAATEALGTVKLTAEKGTEEYNDEIAKGYVIAIDLEKNADGKARNFREGQTLRLVISRGPELIIVPDVAGRRWDEAKGLLEDAGFTLEYNPLADTNGGSFATVVSVTPGAGESLPKGSTLQVVVTLTL